MVLLSLIDMMEDGRWLLVSMDWKCIDVLEVGGWRLGGWKD